MKDQVFKSILLVLIVGGVIIWLAAIIFYGMGGMETTFFICITSQLLIIICCALVIRAFHQQANSDSLTGVSNRRRFFAKMAGVLGQRLPISLMMIDLDNFKRINDTYGHLVGDEVLRQFAQILKDNTRKTDLVARLGGEEFVVVLPLTHHENAVKMAERIKQAVEAKTFICGSADENITVSIGTVTSKFPMDADYLLKFADKALYKAKEKKNMVVAYEQLKTI